MKFKAARQKKRIETVPFPWLRVPQLLVGGAVVVLPLVFTLTGYDKFRLPKDLVLEFVIVCGGLLLLSIRSPRSLPRPASWEGLLGLGLVFVVLHTLLFSNRMTSWQSVFALVFFFALFWILRALATPGFRTWVWYGLGVTLAASGVMTTLQYYGLFDSMVMEATGDVVMGRINPAGFIGEVNSGGFLFGLISILLVRYVVTDQPIWMRVLAGLLIVANLAGLAFARTMTAVVGLAVCGILWLAFHHWWLFRRSAGLTRTVVFLWIGLLLGGLGMAAVGYKSGIAERIQLVISQAQRGDYLFATAGRQPLYLLTWEMTKEQPWTGRGLGTFGEDFFYFKANTEIGQNTVLLEQQGAFRQAHNEYLQVWEELGIGGFVLFLALFVGLLISALRLIARLKGPEEAYEAGIYAVGLAFVAVSCLAFFPLRISVTASLLTMLAACLSRLQPNAEMEEAGGMQPGPASPSKPLLLLALLLSLGWGYVQAQRWMANNDVGVAAYLLQQSGQERFTALQVRAFADEALNRLNRAEVWLWNSGTIANLKGTALLQLGRFDEAAESYGRAVERAPSPEVYTNLAAANTARNALVEARGNAEMALKYEPNFWKAQDALKYLKEALENR